MPGICCVVRPNLLRSSDIGDWLVIPDVFDPFVPFCVVKPDVFVPFCVVKPDVFVPFCALQFGTVKKQVIQHV
jgi:hypothetical protein